MGSILATSAGIMVPQASAPASPYHIRTQEAITWLTGIGETWTDPQKSAIDRIVRDLHGEVNVSYATSNVWSKFVGLWPIVGGTAGTHSLNLKTPGTHTLTYMAGVTHNALGLHSNSARTLTGLISSVSLILNNKHFSGYSKTVPAGTWPIVASNEATGGSTFDGIFLNAGGAPHYFYADDLNNTNTTLNAKGWYIVNRDNSANIRAGRNTVYQSLTSAASALQNSSQLTIGSNLGNPGNLTICFASAGTALTDAESLNVFNAVQACQTSLARAENPATALMLAVILAFLLTTGISLTDAQIFQLNELLLLLEAGGTPAPPAAVGKKSKKAKTKEFTVNDLAPEIVELVRSMGHKI